MSQAGHMLRAASLASLAVVGVLLLHLGCASAEPTPSPSPMPGFVTHASSQPTRIDANPVVTAAPPTPVFGDASTPVAEGVVVDHESWAYFIADPVVDAPDNGFPYGEVYSGLVRISGARGVVEPELASDWTVSPDGLRYSFQLREGIAFSDGRPVTADDVKWSWERALSPQHAPERAREVLGAIVGAEAMLAGAARTLDGVTVVDAASLTVDLIRPRAHFLLGLADPAASVLSRVNFESWGTLNWQTFPARLISGGVTTAQMAFDELPAGTGPFRVAEIDALDFVKLEPNLHHWRHVPTVAEVAVANLFRLNREQGLPRPTLQEFDIVRARKSTYDTISAGRNATYNGESLSGMTPLAASRGPELVYVALNSAVPPLDDVEFRRALLQSARRPDFRAAAAFVQGLPPLHADGLLPPDFPGGGAKPGSLEPDRSAAEASLARSRYARDDAAGASPYAHLELLDDGSLHYRRFYWQFAPNWKDWLGIRVDDLTVPGLTQDEYEELMTGRDGRFPPPPTAEFEQRLEAGTLQMRYVHAVPSYPDPCAILCRIPDLFGPNAQSDETRQLRELLDDAAATADRAARIAKYQAIEAHILDRALVIPVFWDDGMTYRLVKPYISGYKVPAYGGSMYEDVVVDTTHPDYPTDR